MRYFTFFLLIPLLLNHASDLTAAVILPEQNREVAIIASGESYYPARIVVYKGESVKFFFSSINREGSCLKFDKDPKIYSAHLGEVVEFTQTFTQSGEIKYFCPGGAIGSLVVLSRDYDRKSTIPRDSWRPRDEGMVIPDRSERPIPTEE